MKQSRITFVILILAIASLLSACGAQASQGWPGLASDSQNAYLAFNQFVYAVDLSTGQQAWRFPAEKAESNLMFYAPPAISPEGQVIVASYAQNGSEPRLYSLDAETGEMNWVYEEASNHYIAGPLVTDEGIYAPNADGRVYAVNPGGAERWTYTTERSVWASPTTNESCDCVFVASMDHRLYALNAQTGELRWKTEDLGGALASPPTIYDGMLFQGTSDNQMLALDASNGETIWAFETAGWVWSGAAFDNGVIYFGDLEGNLYAVEAESGTEVWSIQTDSAVLSKPLVQGDLIFYTTEGTNLYAINKDGETEWRKETPFKVYGPVLAANDLLLVSQTDVNSPLIAYDMEGDLQWTFTVEED
jgi:outer membrane protein assembly factor BamB